MNKIMPGFKLHVSLKIIAVLLVFYSIIGGFLIDVPRLHILNETIRNLFFHVTTWFAMVFLFIVSFAFSIRYLRYSRSSDELWAKSAVYTGMIFGIAGLLTGMLWAKYTWGSFWVPDPKLNGAAVALLTYLAYIVLRNSINDPIQRGKVSAVYNIFAFVMMLVFVFVLPRMTDSLHPGNGGNPAFSQYDLDNKMRLVFYPAVIGWILLGLWMMEITVRIQKAYEKLKENQTIG
ncbi:MAG: cytochrome c biogenesis protein CcsA [Salibacteraceae bacterium]